MGLDSSFCLVFPRRAIDIVLDAFSKHVATADREKLQSLPKRCCLNMLFPQDGEVMGYLDLQESPCSKEGNFLSVGCVWTTIYAGSELACLWSAAATTDMSLLFNESDAVKNTWLNIAETSAALALFLDIDHTSWNMLHPRKVWVERPSMEDYGWPLDDIPADVDKYLFEALEKAGIAGAI
ncbi:hypothetical protein [Oligoflexus tunisiensis]|uniref:hypothetical protein n=1 Tax=Oligoflexus tunisiensis TaxID=708132 RepID=UPI00114D1CC9|nr:hypothetical protein [Oligoflexus tunisiensis]